MSSVCSVLSLATPWPGVGVEVGEPPGLGAGEGETPAVGVECGPEELLTTATAANGQNQNKERKDVEDTGVIRGESIRATHGNSVKQHSRGGCYLLGEMRAMAALLSIAAAEMLKT
jgi:hypothetical protein